MLIDIYMKKCYYFFIKGGGYMTLGEKIYKLRTERNLSQGNLSEKLDVSRQSISKWENGAATPDLDKIIKLSEVFGITIDELVKSDNIPFPQEEKTAQAAIKKESTFPPRKIIGTVLLSLSFLIWIIFFALGGISGFGAGLIFSSPLILCGIICLVFKKNIGLWCGWAVFFCIDMYLRLAVGINRTSVFIKQLWIYDADFIRILISLAQLFILVLLMVITVFRFWKIRLESKKLPVIFWSVYLLLRISLAVFAASHLYRILMHNLLSTANTWIYTIFASLYSWIYTGFFVAALVLTVRYFYTKKHKTL